MFGVFFCLLTNIVKAAKGLFISVISHLCLWTKVPCRNFETSRFLTTKGQFIPWKQLIVQPNWASLSDIYTDSTLMLNRTLCWVHPHKGSSYDRLTIPHLTAQTSIHVPLWLFQDFPSVRNFPPDLMTQGFRDTYDSWNALPLCSHVTDSVSVSSKSMCNVLLL